MTQKIVRTRPERSHLLFVSLTCFGQLSRSLGMLGYLHPVARRAASIAS